MQILSCIHVEHVYSVDVDNDSDWTIPFTSKNVLDLELQWIWNVAAVDYRFSFGNVGMEWFIFFT